MNDDFSKVEHTYIENKDELYKFRGAKYLQSDINKSYVQVKKFQMKEGMFYLQEHLIKQKL